MALIFVPVTFFGEQKETVRFEELSNYHQEIGELTDWMKHADIVWRIDSLHDQSFDMFWQLASKLQFDFQKHASSCILKVESITVPIKCGDYGDDVTREFQTGCRSLTESFAFILIFNFFKR